MPAWLPDAAPDLAKVARLATGVLGRTEPTGNDHTQLRRVLGQVAAGVTVVTTFDGLGSPLGLTVSAFCSVSLDPPLVLICIHQRSTAHAGLCASGLFGVSVLAEDQEAISRRFATSGLARFESLPLQRGRSGVLLIPGALAHLECRVVSTVLAGDHVIYIGKVLDFANYPGWPLVHQGSRYCKLHREQEGAPVPFPTAPDG